jgi:hypothetical protein
MRGINMNEEEQEELRRLVQSYGPEEILRFIGQVIGEEEMKKCSFCGLPREQVKHMIAAGCGRPFGFICSECIELCNQIIEKHTKNG